MPKRKLSASELKLKKMATLAMATFALKDETYALATEQEVRGFVDAYVIVIE